MAVSAFASTTDLVDSLRSFRLLSAGELAQCRQFVQEHPAAAPQRLIDFALEQDILTRFQAEHILAGTANILRLPPFVLRDNAGSGYAGPVFQARGQSDGRPYLIKILSRGTRAGTPRLAQMMRRFSDFRHPAVVPIACADTVDERAYLVWPQPTKGKTLEQLVQEKGKLSPRQVVHYAVQTAYALDACHRAGLCHGLLKAADLHIEPGHKVVIKDLGIGFLLTLSREDSTLDTMTSLGQLASGLDWASPESLLDPRDRTPLSDQYSLGCVLYYALSGQVPFPVVSKVRKMMAHQMEEPELLREVAPEVPARLVAIVERLMQKVPSDRYAGMAEVEQAFRSLLTRQPAAPRGPKRFAPGPGRSRRQPRPSRPSTRNRRRTPACSGCPG